jgi:hypothetical protein
VLSSSHFILSYDEVLQDPSLCESFSPFSLPPSSGGSIHMTRNPNGFSPAFKTFMDVFFVIALMGGFICGAILCFKKKNERLLPKWHQYEPIEDQEQD